MALVVLGISHHTSPVEVRERFALKEVELPAALDRLRSAGVVREAVLLSTCNRVEVYAASDAPAPETLAALRGFLAAGRGDADSGAEFFYQHAEGAALEHLFKVASGLDSMVLGETEILGQLKKAYDLALQHKATGGRLNKAFQKAFNVAKQIRTETQIQRGSTSVAAVAVELAEKIFSELNHRQVMVLGAGETSEKAARALLSRGAHSILVSNRSYERAEVLARELGGRAVHFEQWDREFDRIDIVISSTSAPHYVLDRAKLAPIVRSRGGRPLLLIDIAVPRDIEPEVNFLDGVYLYNIDDLQAIADSAVQQRREEISRCEAIIRARVAELLTARPAAPAGGPQPHALGQESSRA